MRSTMQHVFSQVPKAEIPRSAFNRSFGCKTTFDSGYLVPVFVDEALPGDTFNCKMTAFTRLATPIYPFMDNVFIESFFFAVPIRLIWDNFQKFNGEQIDPGDSTDFLVPQLNSGAGFSNTSLHDYLGLPTLVSDIDVNSLHHRAYNLIYNEWFRDQNLIDSAVVDRDDGPDNASDYSQLRRRGKRHDYFTSCLPWPQKGDSVEIGITGYGTVNDPTVIGDGNTPTFTVGGAGHWLKSAAAGTGVFWDSATTTATSAVWNNPHLVLTDAEVDLTTATAVNINMLRQAFQLQKLFERDARGGTRYTEIIKSHFGVTSPDARLQRPEYLGGGSARININPIAQTSSSDGTSPQGNLAAYGVGTLNNHGFVKSFTEHCVLIGLVSVRADMTYQQGLDRMFSRQTRYDFYWPALSHLGEQAVLNKEIYCDGSANDDDVFGYQERYAEYRYKPSKITGLFRSNAANGLDSWHLAQDFGSLPALNQTFIEENPPISRVVAVPSEPEFLFDSYFDLKCVRPMPVYSVPGLIDHF